MVSELISVPTTFIFIVNTYVQQLFLLRLREYHPSHLAFRQQSDKDDTEDINHPQNQSDCLEQGASHQQSPRQATPMGLYCLHPNAEDVCYLC